VSTVAIVPAKRFAAAKQRLAPALEPSWRRRLAAAMLADVLASLRLTAGIEETLLVSRDPDAADLADEHGAADLATDADRSLSIAPCSIRPSSTAPSPDSAPDLPWRSSRTATAPAPTRWRWRRRRR
jgi:hypothetical protein